MLDSCQAPDRVLEERVRILIAPQEFKGSLSARQAASTIADGIRLAWPEAEVDLLPMADGGPGTVEALVAARGGSATNDGGAGMAQALGARLLDGRGDELPRGGAALAGLERIDVSGLDPRLEGCRVLVAVDVTNPLCGPTGASTVYGPQKGATRE